MPLFNCLFGVAAFSMIVLAGFSAFAGETRFSPPSSSSVLEPARLGEVSVQSGRQGDFYVVEVSSVLSVDPSCYLKTAMDFDRQASLGMPTLVEAHVVSRNGDQLYAWMHTAALGAESKHYLDVRSYPSLNSGKGMGMSFEMLASKPAGASYENNPAFESLEGSLYVQPLAGNSVFVRYFLEARVESLLPQFLIEGFVKGQLSKQISEGLRILASRCPGLQVKGPRIPQPR